MNRIYTFLFLIFFFFTFFLQAQNFIISGGEAFTAALDAGGNVWTWGSNEEGELGRGIPGMGKFDQIPAMVNLGGVKIKSIDAGSANHAIALECGGDVYTWGANWAYQLGDGTSDASVTPIHVKGGATGKPYLTGVKYITSSTGASFAILENTGEVVAWGGYNTDEWGGIISNYGILGNLTTTYSGTPVYVKKLGGSHLTDIIQVDAGDNHCYALDKNGKVWAWGGADPTYNDYTVGLNESSYAIPIYKDAARTQQLDNIKEITAGDAFGLFLDNNGNVWSIGSDDGGALGQTVVPWDTHQYAVRVAAGEQGAGFLQHVKHISACRKTSIAIVDPDNDNLGNVMTWGANYLEATGYTAGGGILGIGTTANIEKQLPVYALKSAGVRLDSVTKISDADGVVYVERKTPSNPLQIMVWGNNNVGQLGTGMVNPAGIGYAVEPALSYPVEEPCPTANLTANNDTVCATESLTFNAGSSGAFTHYIWEKDGVVIGTNDLSSSDRTLWTFDSNYDKNSVTLTGPGLYKVTVWDITPTKVCNAILCPSASSSIVIYGYTSDVAGISGTSVMCESSSLNLTGSPSAMKSYKWSGPNAFQSTTKDIAISDVHPIHSGVYTITITNIYGCTDSESLTIHVDSIPAVHIASTTQSVCLGNAATLTAITLGNTFLWNDNTTITNSYVVSPIIQSTYTVTITKTVNTACTNTASIVIGINKPVLPVITANDSSICAGQTLQLTANQSNMKSYTWAGPNALSNSSQQFMLSAVTSVVAGVYTVTVIDNSNCSASDDILISVNALPDAKAGTDVSSCSGSEVQLSASGGNSYLWSPSTGLSALDIANPTVSISGTSTYIVTVTDVNNCTNSDDIIVSIYPAAIADAGTDISICVGNSTTLNASGGIKYQWNTNEQLATISISPVNNQVYTVTVTDANNCTDDDIVNVTVNQLPNISAGVDVNICIGNSILLAASNAVSYNWSTLENTESIFVAPILTTTYTVTGIDNNSCSNTDEVIVFVNPLPTANFTYSNNTVFEFDEIQFKSSSLGATSWLWVFNDEGLSDSENPLYSFNTSGYKDSTLR